MYACRFILTYIRISRFLYIPVETYIYIYIYIDIWANRYIVVSIDIDI